MFGIPHISGSTWFVSFSFWLHLRLPAFLVIAKYYGNIILEKEGKVLCEKNWEKGFFFYLIFPTKGFPGSSAGKESTCNAGDPGSIPGSGRSTGDRIGYPSYYSWTSLQVQMVKNPPAKWRTWVWSQGWEDPWRGERLPTPGFWPGKLHGQKSLVGYSLWSRKESDMTERLSLSQQNVLNPFKSLSTECVPPGKW